MNNYFSALLIFDLLSFLQRLYVWRFKKQKLNYQKSNIESEKNLQLKFILCKEKI